MDKLTILRIKKQRMRGEEKLRNVNRELALLESVASSVLAGREECLPLVEELFQVNAALWDIEEGKRDCERRQDFGERFVELARRVYIDNDRRAAIKRRINEALGSEIVEEKSYDAY